jgi:hypothetical protein
LSSYSDEASSSFDEQEETTSRLLDYLSFFLSLSIFNWSLSCLRSKESCSTQESLEVPSIGVVFSFEPSPMGGGGISSTPYAGFDIASPSD